MYAGKGVTHSERPAKEIAENGGQFEIIQFWINTPAVKKMKAAEYIPLEKNELKIIESPDQNAQIHMIAGSIDGIKGPIDEDELVVANIMMKEGSNTSFNLDANHNTILYLLDGQITVNGKDITQAKSLIIFNMDGEKVEIKAQENSRMLLLSGKPLEEEVVSYGPFVMNNTTQILEAMRDAQSGKMGILIEEFE